MNELDGLQPDWVLYRDGDNWAVGRTGECYECSLSVDELASAPTIAEAITKAVVEVERRHQEQAARDRDYRQRKADGKLTFVERMNESIARMYAPMVFDAIERPSVIIRRLGNYEAVRTEPAPCHDSADDHS